MIRNFVPDAGSQPVVPGVPLSDHTAAAMCAGWNDVAAGRPYHDVYKKAAKATQLNYELGRLIARCVASKQRLEPWPPSLTYEQMRAHGLVSAEAHEAAMEEHAVFMKGFENEK